MADGLTMIENASSIYGLALCRIDAIEKKMLKAMKDDAVATTSSTLPAWAHVERCECSQSWHVTRLCCVMMQSFLRKDQLFCEGLS